MKTQSFTVTLTFSDKITSDEDVATITQNILNSLVHTANTSGISPDEGDSYTTRIEVEPQFLLEAKVEVLIP